MITIDEFERVQEILGRKEKPKQISHEFAFTGIIRCGNCGGMVTAEEKRKFIKSTQTYATYVYYHCSRRKSGIKCNEPVINLVELEKQIAEEIEKYTIPEEFKDWALGVLRSNHHNETNARDKKYEMLNKAYKTSQRQLDNLVELRLKDLLNDEEFLARKVALQNKITQTKVKLDGNHDRGQNWLELIEKAFNFVTQAKKVFENTQDLKIKREILQTLGSSFILENSRLKIEPTPWLIPIDKYNKAEKALKNRLEPTKNRLPSQDYRSFARRNLHGGDYWESNPDFRDHNPVF